MVSNPHATAETLSSNSNSPPSKSPTIKLTPATHANPPHPQPSSSSSTPHAENSSSERSRFLAAPENPPALPVDVPDVRPCFDDAPETERSRFLGVPANPPALPVDVPDSRPFEDSPAKTEEEENAGGARGNAAPVFNIDCRCGEKEER